MITLKIQKLHMEQFATGSQLGSSAARFASRHPTKCSRCSRLQLPAPGKKPVVLGIPWI